MAFITKNANMILLFLIVLSSTSLVAATVFFQSNFDRINEEYNQKLNELNRISKDLDAKQTLLNKLESEISVKEEREEKLGEQFSEVKTTAEQLATQKKQLEMTAEQLEEELENTEMLLRDTQNELSAKKDQVNALTAENADLVTRLDVCEDQRDNFEDDLDECEAAKAQCTC